MGAQLVSLVPIPLTTACSNYAPPKGILIDTAMNSVGGPFVECILFIPHLHSPDRIIPPPSLLQGIKYFQTTMEDAVKHGLTSIHDAMSFPFDVSVFKTYVSHIVVKMISKYLSRVADYGSALPVR